MNQQDAVLSHLHKLRNQYGASIVTQKRNLLETLRCEELKSRESLNLCHDTLLFLMAYPDNKIIYDLAFAGLEKLKAYILEHENIRTRLFNTGITGSQVCAEFSFEIVKWLKAKYGSDVFIDSITGPTSQMRSILSVVMPLVESEIMQDENTTWQLWMKKWIKKGGDLLDALITVFDQSPIRPEVKDELWTALAINVTINFNRHLQLPARLSSVYYHKDLIKKASLSEKESDKPLRVKLTEDEAEAIIECGRLVLVRYLREIDPVSFSDPSLVSYYQLSRGLSIALFGMRPERRRPVDCYMGYVVFKNGMPLSYAGSWVLFDSGRIGLNVFAPYRGGESLHTFEQILKAHKHVYHLNRFSADPYQVGKNNHDGIKSGAFWMYYKMGFRPIKEKQKEIAEAEAQKQLATKGYRSPASVLNSLADSRLQINLTTKKAVSFDATDLSLVYFNTVQKKYGGDRKLAQQDSYARLSKLLNLGKPGEDEAVKHIIRNWCVILIANEAGLRSNKPLIETLRKLFELKTCGSEEAYTRKMQSSKELRKFMEGVIAGELS